MKQPASPTDHMTRRMPYRVPDRCFEDMEARLLRSAAAVRPAPVFRWRVAAAAAAALVVAVLLFGWLAPTPSLSLDVDEAFASLSADDQDYLIETYEDDIFLTLNY